MRPIVTDRVRVAWSVCLSVCHTSSEPCKTGRTDRDAVWVVDSGGPKEADVQSYSVFARWRQCALMWGHIGATWRIRLNRPSAAAMRSHFKLLWPSLVSVSYRAVTQSLCSQHYTQLYNYTSVIALFYWHPKFECEVLKCLFTYATSCIRQDLRLTPYRISYAPRPMNANTVCFDEVSRK